MMSLFWLTLIALNMAYGMEDCPFYKCDRFLSASLVCANKNMGHIKACNYTKNYTSFKDIVLKNSNITSLDPALFSQMNKLTSLYMSNNSLETLDYRLFRKLKSLKHLDLRHNRLRYLDDRIFKNQKYLQTLLLDGNRLTTLNVNVLAPLQSLINISMTRNPFSCDCELVQAIIWCETRNLTTNVICPGGEYLNTRVRYEDCVDVPTGFTISEQTIIIIISFGACVLFILMLLVFIFYIRKRVKSKDKIDKDAEDKVSPLLLPSNQK